jgi:hypothetical protein
VTSSKRCNLHPSRALSDEPPFRYVYVYNGEALVAEIGNTAFEGLKALDVLASTRRWPGGEEFQLKERAIEQQLKERIEQKQSPLCFMLSKESTESEVLTAIRETPALVFRLIDASDFAEVVLDDKRLGIVNADIVRALRQRDVLKFSHRITPDQAEFKCSFDVLSVTEQETMRSASELLDEIKKVRTRNVSLKEAIASTKPEHASAQSMLECEVRVSELATELVQNLTTISLCSLGCSSSSSNLSQS